MKNGEIFPELNKQGRSYSRQLYKREIELNFAETKGKSVFRSWVECQILEMENTEGY